MPPRASQACFLAPYSALKGVQERGDTGDLPLLPYAAMAVNGVGWIAYGVLAGEPTIWLPNITACLAGVYYWYKTSLPFPVPPPSPPSGISRAGGYMGMGLIWRGCRGPCAGPSTRKTPRTT